MEAKLTEFTQLLESDLPRYCNAKYLHARAFLIAGRIQKPGTFSVLLKRHRSELIAVI
jgi:hypothetical protein